MTKNSLMDYDSKALMMTMVEKVITGILRVL
jgi:hypothetical protein